MRFDVIGGALVGLLIGLLIGLSVGRARADCTGCAPGKAYEEPCLSWWTLPDGERICVEQPWQRRAKATPDIIAAEPELCIFKSEVERGLLRWRACEAVK